MWVEYRWTEMERNGDRWRDRSPSSPKSDQWTKTREGRANLAMVCLELNVIYVVTGYRECHRDGAVRDFT